MAVTKLLQTYIMCLCILYSCSVVLEMKFVKGRYLSHYGAFKFNVPTMYQCAELCQALDECQSITFDKLLKQCKLNSITWPVSGLNTDAHFIYAEKTNIPIIWHNLCSELTSMWTFRMDYPNTKTTNEPTENPIGCENSPCGQQEICVDQMTNYSCHPFYQCHDRIVDVQFCENRARIGGCDEENIGLDPLFTQNNWNWLQTQCKRSCKLCLDHF